MQAVLALAKKNAGFSLIINLANMSVQLFIPSNETWIALICMFYWKQPP